LGILILIKKKQNQNILTLTPYKNTKMEKNIYKELEEIKNEIKSLKALLIQEHKQKQIISLRGLLRGIKVSDEEIDEAKRSLFKVNT